MKSLRLALGHTEATIHPMHAFVCDSPFLQREVLLEGKTADDGTQTLLVYVEGDREAYEEVLASRPEIEEYDVTPESDDTFFVYVRGAMREQEQVLEEAFDRETVVVVPPIEFRSDRTMHLSLVGHSDDLQAALSTLPNEISVEVLRVGDHANVVGDPLTNRQREALSVAWEVGYYAVPREGELTAVADELGCAISTASDLLRRAEARLVADALGTRG